MRTIYFGIMFSEQLASNRMLLVEWSLGEY